jgi:hypothetical protein
LLFVRGGDQTWPLPTPPVAIARFCTEAKPIHNEESTDPKRDQAVGHSMKHASFLDLASQHVTEDE